MYADELKKRGVILFKKEVKQVILIDSFSDDCEEPRTKYL